MTMVDDRVDLEAIVNQDEDRQRACSFDDCPTPAAWLVVMSCGHAHTMCGVHTRQTEEVSATGKMYCMSDRQVKTKVLRKEPL